MRTDMSCSGLSPLNHAFFALVLPKGRADLYLPSFLCTGSILCLLHPHSSANY